MGRLEGHGDASRGQPDQACIKQLFYAGYTLKHLKEGGYSIEQVIKARMNGNVYAGYPWQDVFKFWSSGEDILVFIRRRNEQPNECAPFLIGFGVPLAAIKYAAEKQGVTVDSDLDLDFLQKVAEYRQQILDGKAEFAQFTGDKEALKWALNTPITELDLSNSGLDDHDGTVLLRHAFKTSCNTLQVVYCFGSYKRCSRVCFRSRVLCHSMVFFINNS